MEAGAGVKKSTADSLQPAAKDLRLMAYGQGRSASLRLPRSRTRSAAKETRGKSWRRLYVGEGAEGDDGVAVCGAALRWKESWLSNWMP